MTYKKLPSSKIYRLINTNPLLLISTISKDNKHNIAPIAWCCPQEMEPPRLLLCISINHQTFKNIKETGVFTASLPNTSHLQIVKNTGSISGKSVDKFEEFNIKYFLSKKNSFKVPENVTGYLECNQKKIIKIDETAVIIADIQEAYAHKEGFINNKINPTIPTGKVLYHLGESCFGTITIL
ncbi:MAG: flavin reductase family protein [Chitinispirillaceae bacterium]|nr:flavin reductase family protein [Chitinispirillaceae bacterium]